jgi:dTDP-4-dehydrorhamnose reductase
MRIIAKAKPEVIVHVAAETNVDKCESSRAEAWRMNAEGTRYIAKAYN